MRKSSTIIVLSLLVLFLVMISNKSGYAEVYDARQELNLISKESFAESLVQLCDSDKNHLGSVDSYCMTPSQSGYLKQIASSKRFAKLCGQYQDDPRGAAKIIIAQYKADVEKCARFKAQGALKGWLYDLYNPRLKDQSDLPLALASRILASELLIARFAICEALPLVVKSYELRKGTEIANIFSSSFTCDRILTAPLNAQAPSAMKQVRDEYLALRKIAASEKDPRTGICFFQYEKLEYPSFRSMQMQDAHSPTGMAPGAISPGIIEIEIPPVRLGNVAEQMNRSTLPPDQIIEFAKRYMNDEKTKNPGH